jgi:hypothetical protein
MGGRRCPLCPPRVGWSLPCTGLRFPGGHNTGKILDHRTECGVLDRLVEAVRAGESLALVVHGGGGRWQTKPLEYLAGRTSGCRASAAGVERRWSWRFAGLHQLCVSVLEGLEALPVPQRDALRTAVGIRSGQVPSCRGGSEPSSRALSVAAQVARLSAACLTFDL